MGPEGRHCLRQGKPPVHRAALHRAHALAACDVQGCPRTARSHVRSRASQLCGQPALCGQHTRRDAVHDYRGQGANPLQASKGDSYAAGTEHLEQRIHGSRAVRVMSGTDLWPAICTYSWAFTSPQSSFKRSVEASSSSKPCSEAMSSMAAHLRRNLRLDAASASSASIPS